MSGFMIYLLEASVGLIAFYLVYFLFLKEETWFQLNRAYLITTMLLALLLPLFHISYLLPIEVQTVGEISPAKLDEIITEAKALSYQNWLIDYSSTIFLWIYLIGIGVTSFVFFRSFYRLLNLYKKGTLKRQNGIVHLNKTNYKDTFSFFNIIFWGDEVNNYSKIERHRVYLHEMAHIKGNHSIDLLFVEILKIVFWFNPVVYSYKSFLQLIHEYIADEEVIAIEGAALQYATFLVKQAKRNNLGYSRQLQDGKFCNYLLYKPIKNRLIMMKKIKSKRRNVLKMLSSLPILSGLVFCFCVEYITMPTANAQTQRVATPPDITSGKKGSCYARCHFPDQEKTVTYNVFTGSIETGIDLEIKEISSNNSSTKWVKIKGVWTAVKTNNPTTEKIKVVKDISQTDQYEARTFKITEKNSSEWAEVICSHKITSDFITLLQKRLNAGGKSVEVTGKFNDATKKALVSFQKEHNLPSGNLDVQTLKVLNLESYL